LPHEICVDPSHSKVWYAQLKLATGIDDTLSQLILNGHAPTCTGRSHKTFNIEMKEVRVRLSDDIETRVDFQCTFPGTVLETCVGDSVSHGSMAHGLDTHAFQIDAKNFGPGGAGASLKIESG